MKNCILFLETVNCRKWPISAIRDLLPDRVFFCDRDRIIIDRELQGPIIQVSRPNCNPEMTYTPIPQDPVGS